VLKFWHRRTECLQPTLKVHVKKLIGGVDEGKRLQFKSFFLDDVRENEVTGLSWARKSSVGGEHSP